MEGEKVEVERLATWWTWRREARRDFGEGEEGEEGVVFFCFLVKKTVMMVEMVACASMTARGEDDMMVMIGIGGRWGLEWVWVMKGWDGMKIKRTKFVLAVLNTLLSASQSNTHHRKYIKPKSFLAG